MQNRNEHIIGFASSMFQTSGPDCGRSNWTEAAERGRVPDSTQPISHWDHFEEDLDLMAKTGIKSYRVSIEWSHIEPVKGKYDDEVIARYQRLIDACLERGIVPMLTLYHFNEPFWFTELGSFEREENIEHFVEFSKHVFSVFSPKVNLWCTINEPAVQAFMGYFLGKFPPRRTGSFTQTVEVLKNLLKAHVDVYQALKPLSPESQIGIVHNVLRFKPLYTHDPIAYFLTNLFTPLTDDIVMNFFRTGRIDYRVFNSRVVNYITCRREGFHFQDDRAPHSNDFIGLNFYANPIVGPNRRNGYGPTCRAGQVMGDMYLPLDPEGFSAAIDQVASLGKPVYITETGVADRSDVLRQRLLPLYFAVIDSKIAEGVDVRGTYLWSAFDNYEWNEGNTKSFGFFDAHRNPRDSVDVLKRIIEEHRTLGIP